MDDIRERALKALEDREAEIVRKDAEQKQRQADALREHVMRTLGVDILDCERTEQPGYTPTYRIAGLDIAMYWSGVQPTIWCKQTGGHIRDLASLGREIEQAERLAKAKAERLAKANVEAVAGR